MAKYTKKDSTTHLLFRVKHNVSGRVGILIFAALLSLSTFLFGMELGIREQDHEIRIMCEGGADEHVVASRAGTRYHFPWCAGAFRIKEENRVVFPSAKAAREAGLLPAGNCKGLP